MRWWSSDADDGQLAWRYLVAPGLKRMVSYEQVESAWPVSGSVIVHDDVVYALAGRNMFFDGGLRLKPPADADGKLTYKYDPRNPVPTVGGQNLNMPKGPMDQRKIESRPDVLLFSSGPLERPVEITGRRGMPRGHV